MARRIFLLVLLISWLAANLLWGAEFHAFGDLGGDDGYGKTSQALAIAGDQGRFFVVGDSLATAGLGITIGIEAFLWEKPNARTRVGTLTTKDAYSSAKAAALQGRLVVGESHTEEGKRAFRWSRLDGIVSLGVLPEHDESVAWGISGDGRTIVGESSSPDEELAFRWTAGEIVALGHLPGGKNESTAMAISFDGTTIVGHSNSQNGTEACAWTAGGIKGLGSLDGDRFASRAFGVSADGAVIVGESLSSNGPEAFRWTQQDGMQPLGDLPQGEFRSRASGVSADGKTIVGTATSDIGLEGFILNSANGIRSLGRLMTQKGLAKGWRLCEARGISSDGKVVIGIGRNPKGESAGWIAEL